MSIQACSLPGGRHDNPCPCGFETFLFSTYHPPVGKKWTPDGSGACSMDTHYGGTVCMQCNISNGQVIDGTHTNSTSGPITLPVVPNEAYVFGVFFPTNTATKQVCIILNGLVEVDV